MLTEQQALMQAQHVQPASPARAETDAIVKHHVWGAVGVCFLPFPVLDYVALTGIQINLLRKLSHCYGVPFFQKKVKNFSSALLSSAVPQFSAAPLAFSIAKIIPIFGQIAGVTALPAVAGAATYALGKVFVQHFESGGTFLTFDPNKVKDYYMEMFEEGERVAAEAAEEKKAASKKAEKPVAIEPVKLEVSEPAPPAPKKPVRRRRKKTETPES